MKTCTRCKREHEETTKQCRRCLEISRAHRRNNPETYKAHDQKQRQRRKERGQCNTCGVKCSEVKCERCKLRCREWHDSHKGRMTAYNRERKHNITQEEYDLMVKTQDGKCASCGNPPNGSRPLSVDHDHKTGKIRELLCNGCNSALGHAKESPERLIRLAVYTLKHLRLQGLRL